jgi:tetraprenyl-beta-curcumene synthase
VGGYPRNRLTLAKAFSGAAVKYWVGIFPQVKREQRHWHRKALRIADPGLRRQALITQQAERGNLDGAAAFAVLAPRAHRARVVRASVAFQITYEYVDSLAEEPSSDPVANGRRLHLALLAALNPSGGHPDYYEFHASKHDNGYIRSLVDACREALGALPSYTMVEHAALHAAERMATYQSLNHDPDGEIHTLARWASKLTPEGTGLRWWETAAAAASSLTVLPLIAAAARPTLSAHEAAAVNNAYFPWIGALNQLLDSLIDRAADREAGHHSLVAHYQSAEEAATRLGSIAARATRATEPIPESVQHAMILAAMSSHYLTALTAPSELTPGARMAARQVLDAMGALATPTMIVLRLRRDIGRAFAGTVLDGRRD